MQKWFVSFLTVLFSGVTISSAAFADSWTTKAPMPTARSYNRAATVNGKIYVIGGWNASEPLLDVVEEYDPVSNSWTTKAPMPTQRNNMGVCAFENKIYVVGGHPSGGSSLPHLSTVEVYDSVTDSWETKSPMLTMRNAPTCSVVDGKVYVFGGRYSGNTDLSSVEVYDPQSDSWSQGTPMPRRRSAAASIINGNKILVIGGMDNARALSFVDEYDTITNAWSTKTSMPTPRAAFGVGMINNKIYAVGGWDDITGYSNTNEAYDLALDSWEILTPQAVAHNNPASAVAQNKLYVFGGHIPGKIPVADTQEYSPLNDGLVAYYPFNGNTNDESGNGNHGTNNGATLTTDRFGSVGSAYYFDGLGDDIEVLNSSSLTILNNITVSAWINAKNYKTISGLIGKRSGASGFDLYIESSVNIGLSGPEFFMARFGTGRTNFQAQVGTNSIDTNQWYHLVGVYNNSEIKFYVNGMYDSNRLQSAQLGSNISNLTIGKTSSKNAPFDGQIDDIRIYNRALSEAEVQELYNQEKPIDLDAGLVAYYPFNGNANDESGHGNDGNVFGGLTYVNGVLGQAVSFDGLDDYIEVPDSPSLQITDNITMSSWVWLTDTSSGGILNKRQGDSGFGLVYSETENLVAAQVGANGTVASGTHYGGVKTINPLSTGRWYHLTGVYNNEELRIFVDGHIQNTSIKPNSLSSNTTSLFIGIHRAAVGTLYANLNGKIDEVRIYNRALSGAEVQAMYEQEKPIHLNDGLVAYYPFNGNANDGSGNGNDGTVNGATPTTDRFGNADSAYYFDGDNDYIDGGGDPSTMPVTSITVSAWIKVETFTTGYVIGRNYGNQNGYQIFSNDHKARFGVDNSLVNSDSAFSSGVWYHLAMSYDGNILKGYVDGALQSDLGGGVGPINAAINNLRIGRQGQNEGYSSSYSFHGSIDDIRIYNRALSDVEVQTLYASESQGISYSPGDVKWNYQTGDILHSSPAIGDDGTIYFGSWDNNIYAVNPDGTEKWSFPTGDNISSSPAIGSDGTVYVGSWDGKLYAINPNGTEKWAFQTLSRLQESSPAIAEDGTVYIGSRDLELYAINPDGSFKWSFVTDNYIFSSPAIGSDGTVYVNPRGSSFYAISPDGSLKWQFNVDYGAGGSDCSPAIDSDGTIYVSTNGRSLLAINPNGTLKWKSDDFSTGTDSSPVIASDGTVYIATHGGILYALNPANGAIKWQFVVSGGIRGVPAIGENNVIYVGSESIQSYFYAINQDGTEKWKLPADGYVNSSPVIASDGTIYVGANDGKMYAIQSEAYGLATTPWPMHQRGSKHISRADQTLIDLQAGLVAYYPFNGNAYDESENGNDAAEYNGVSYVNGVKGQAANFDGIDDYIRAQSNAALNFGTGDFTLNFWFKTSAQGGFLLDSRTSNEIGYYINIPSGGLKYSVDESWGGIKLQSNLTNTSDGQWHQFSGVKSGNDLYVYVDNILREHVTGPMVDIGTSQPINFGASKNPSSFYSGLLDEVRIYDRALSEAEIQTLYEQEKPIDLNDGLVAYYPFNGNANDESGNGNDGIVNGASPTTDRFGNVGSAFSFDGIDDNIDCGNDSSTMPEKISISVWVKPTTPLLSGDTRYVLGRNNSRIDGYDIFFFGGSEKFRFDIDTDSYSYSSSPANLDTWHHVVMTYDGNELVGYVDSLEEIRNTLQEGFIDYVPYSLSIGRVNWNSKYPFQGSIDDIRIYNRALSDAEILALYNENNPNSCPSPSATEQRLASWSGGVRTEFGSSVSVSGNQAIIGYDYFPGNGSHYGAPKIYEKIGNTWTEKASIVSFVNNYGDGSRVAISGDYAIIGSHASDSAFIVEKVNGTWIEATRLIPSDDDPNSYVHFGGNVAISGNYAVVGANRVNNMRGAVYVFERINGTWIEVAKLTASDAAYADNLGLPVAISGNYLIAGAHGKNNSTGAAYVFERINGTWTEVAKLTASDGEPFDVFGFHLSIEGTTAVIAAYDDDNGNGIDAGAAYVFERVNGIWTAVAKLTASDGAAGDRFGNVSNSGNYIAVGAPYDEDNGSDSGSVYIYKKVNGTWAENTKLTASDGMANQVFGSRTALSGNNLLVGAYQYSTNTGTAYTYDLCDNTTTSLPVNLPPTAPILDGSSIPANEAVDVDPQSIELSWTASIDPDGDAIEYCVTVNEDGTPDDIPAFTGCDDSVFTNDTTFPLHAHKTLDFGKTYWWAVWAKDANDNWSPASDWWSFTTKGSYPIIDSFTVALSKSWIVVSEEENLFFNCTAHDDDGNVVGYTVDFGDGTVPQTNSTGIFDYSYSVLGEFQAQCVAVDDMGYTSISAPIYISVTEKADWTKLSGPWGQEHDKSFSSIAIHSTDPDIIYAGSGSGIGLFKSYDAGISWTEINVGIEKLGVPFLTGTHYPPISDIAISPSHPNVLYIGTLVNDPPYIGGKGQIYRSVDGGASWQEITIVEDPNFLGLARIQGATWDISVDPQDPFIVYAGIANQGVFKSVDGGANWTKIFGGMAPQGAINIYNLVKTNPHQPDNIIISGFTYYYVKTLPVFDFNNPRSAGTNGLLPIGVYQSFDGGNNWDRINSTTISFMLPSDLIFGENPGEIYVSTIAYMTNLFLPFTETGIFQSTDWGTSWNILRNSCGANIRDFSFYNLGLFQRSLLTSSSRNIYMSGLDNESWIMLPGFGDEIIKNFISNDNKLYALTSDGIYTIDSPEKYLGYIDSDCDFIDDFIEESSCTLPNDDDSDDDGLLDGIEDNNRNGILDPGETDPCDKDTDDDGLTDGNTGTEDLNANGIVDPGESDPTKIDTDGDGILDGTEKGLVAPESDDTDLSAGNFIPDADPSTTTDPADADSDDDGILDGNEDLNGDGFIDQLAGETDANNPDTDGDGIFDGTERGLTSPQNPDATNLEAGFFIPDADPSTVTDPTNSDTDGDGIGDGDEDINKDGGVNLELGETNPTSACGDGVLETPEECDDGNLIDGDGCSSQCLDECIPEPEICGDGIDQNCDGVDDVCSVPGDLDGNGIVDRLDVNVINLYRDQPASSCTECDIDGNGTITILDARQLMSMCTYSRCASQ